MEHYDLYIEYFKDSAKKVWQKKNIDLIELARQIKPWIENKPDNVRLIMLHVKIV